MGYTDVRYYVGGMADWIENAGPVEKLDSAVVADRPKREVQANPLRGASWSTALDVLVNWPLDRLILFWISMIVGFGLVYWVAAIRMGSGLQAGGNPVEPDFGGLVTAIYFSFVTALSIGYGDVVPVGLLRILAVIEGTAGLLIFGCLISKLVSRRQEELVQEIHRITFEERLDRVRTSLHLVFSDLESIAQVQREHSALPEQVLRRLESAVRVFCGELQTVHDLLYRTQCLPEEEALESLLANLAVSLEALTELLHTQPRQLKKSAALESSLRSVSNLSKEICGECVPRSYAPAMKEWMDQIQQLARKIA